MRAFSLSYLAVFNCLMVQRAIKASRPDEVEPVVKNNGLLNLGSVGLTSWFLREFYVPASCSFFQSCCATVIDSGNKKRERGKGSTGGHVCWLGPNNFIWQLNYIFNVQYNCCSSEIRSSWINSQEDLFQCWDDSVTCLSSKWYSNNVIGVYFIFIIFFILSISTCSTITNKCCCEVEIFPFKKIN